jgi:hypothetical protein
VYNTLHTAEEEELNMFGRAFSKLQIALELKGRLLQCNSHCVSDSNYLLMLEKL